MRRLVRWMWDRAAAVIDWFVGDMCEEDDDA